MGAVIVAALCVLTSGWTVDGAPCAPCGSNSSGQLTNVTATNVTANHTIAVSFVGP